MRRSSLIYNITSRLIYTKWRDPDGDPKLHLFGQMKRITRQWLDQCLECSGGTFPAQLLYQELADMACERITAAIARSETKKERPVKAILDSYNPVGSTIHVNFNTSKTDRWETSPQKCHLNWVILDSNWEAEFCRVVENHPKVKAYVKNHNLGLEVPYRYGAETRKYYPDFIVVVDDGNGDDNPLHLIVEIKGFRFENTKDKKAAIENYWIPGVNNLHSFGRWAFAEFRDIFEMEKNFKELMENELNRIVEESIKS